MDFLKQVIPDQLKRLIIHLVNRITYEIRLLQAAPVLVYQMGKVGSSSVFQSIQKHYSGVALHAHSFSSNHQKPLIGRLFRRVIVQGKPVKVISLTREPVGRNVSAFFQNFERDTGVPYSRANFSVDELKEIFLLNYRHEIPLEWFDNNIKANFGIDVFATQFPENGVATYENKNVELLVMRSEIDDEEKCKAISDFLELAHFQIERANVGEEKDYSSTYVDFKRKVRFSSDYIDRMCCTRYFIHFYGQEAIDAVKTQWSKG